MKVASLVVEKSRTTFKHRRIKNLQDLLSWGIQELSVLGPEEARASAECLLQEILNVQRYQLYLAAEDCRTDAVKKFRHLIALRKKRIPVAYLLGKAPFRNQILEVNRGCLIPRPETEILVDRFIEQCGFREDDEFSFLDLGSGSGAIGISLLLHYSRARATFSDLSPDALAVTRRNLKRFDLLDRAETVCSDLFQRFQGRTWSAITSNPPYLSEEDWKEAQPEILAEPREALSGGPDGLHFHRRISNEAGDFLEKKGWLVLEAGKGQAAKISSELHRRDIFGSPLIFKDYSGIDRVVFTQKVR